MKNLCVFAGSRLGSSPAFSDAARDLVDAVAQRGLGLVYGAGNVGLMNVLAETALERGVGVIGIIPNHLVERDAAHQGLDELLVVDDMLARKALMAERSDAFVAIPGGVGTFDEIFEMLTWAQLGIHDKPCGILNVEGYFDPLRTVIENAQAKGFLADAHGRLLQFETEPNRLLDRLLGTGSTG